MEMRQVLSLIAADIDDIAEVNGVNPWTLLQVTFSYQQENSIGRDYALRQLENAIFEDFTTEGEINICIEIIEQIIADLEY